MQSDAPVEFRTEFSIWKFKMARKAKREFYRSNEIKLGISTYCWTPLFRHILATTEQMRIESLYDALLGQKHYEGQSSLWLGRAGFRAGGFP